MKSILLFDEPDVLRHMLSTVEHEHETRQLGQLRLPKVRSEAGKRRLAYGAAKQYNSLPPAMKDTLRMSRFKADLARMLGSHRV